jgi:NADH:ubiquinone reductase (H+-translocating)
VHVLVAHPAGHRHRSGRGLVAELADSERFDLVQQAPHLGQVLPDCTLPGHPEVFAIGDMMALDQLPGVAEVAMQSGIHAANTIKRRLSGKDAAPFKYRDLGSMATISRFSAVVSFKGLRLSGFPGWLMWLVVHVTFLTGFKNRFTSLLHWANTFLSGQRAERTITFRQVIARVAIEQAGGEKFMQALIPAHGTHAEQVTHSAPGQND